jgi:hypothetical protein
MQGAQMTSGLYNEQVEYIEAQLIARGRLEDNSRAVKDAKIIGGLQYWVNTTDFEYLTKDEIRRSLEDLLGMK